MFRFHIQGLCIAVLEPSRLRVLMLNSGVRRTLVPFHIQSGFAPRTSVDLNQTTFAPLPSVEGRWLTTKKDKDLVGWGLAGYHAICGTGLAPQRPQSTVGDAAHPVPVKRPDWSDLHWVLNASRFLPKGRLREVFKERGINTSTIVDFMGGRLEGGQPVDEMGSQFIWHIRKGYEQAITDTLDVVFDGAPPSLRVFDTRDKHVGDVIWAEEGEAWIINDATELNAQAALTAAARKSGKPSCDDLKIFLEAFDAPRLDKLAVNPHAVRNFASTKLFTGAHCSMIFVE